MSGGKSTLRGMKAVLGAFAVVQGLMAVLFDAAGLVLLLIAGRTGWEAVAEGLNAEAAQTVI